MVDLHVHSTCSDGTYTPTALVDYAIEKGLSAFALTDHDSVDGLQEALDYAKGLRENALTSGAVIPEVIPGIELSTDYQGQEVHVVGLYIDYRNKEFQSYLQDFLDSRYQRNVKMCEKLRELGFSITYEALEERFPGAVLTRAHYARYLLEHGYIKSIKEAFDRYLGDRCPCYVPREKVTPFQAVELILKAGGIPILAHPILYHMSDARLDNLVQELKTVGLIGIEAIYSTYAPAEERQIRRLAEKHHLLISGGSDFHGENKPGLDLAVGYGKLYIPDEVLLHLRQTLKNVLFTDLDGTLLLSNSTVSQDTKAFLDSMIAEGHRLVLSSGRPLPSVLEVIRENHLDYPGSIVISYNGGCIYDVEKKVVITQSLLSQEIIAQIETLAKNAGLYLHGYTPDAANVNIVCHAITEETTYYTRRIHLPIIELCRTDCSSLADFLQEGSHKVQAISLNDKAALEAFRISLEKKFGNALRVFFSNDQYLEIMPGGVGKDFALSYIASYLPVHPHHTFAAGDAENDIEMLQAAYVGIAMKNAASQVKEAADYITDEDNDHDGLSLFLKKFF